MSLRSQVGSIALPLLTASASLSQKAKMVVWLLVALYSDADLGCGKCLLSLAAYSESSVPEQRVAPAD